jgi:arylsulfatase A-like enzyme
MSKSGIQIGWCAIVSVFFAAFSFSAKAIEMKPNVVFILIDSLGWSDTTLYGMTQLYQTPNIERIARRGMLFSKAYADGPLDCPTRASILTGQNPARIGMTEAYCAKNSHPSSKTEPTDKSPPDRKIREAKSATHLDTHDYPLAKAMQAAGYKTGHFGKWQLGLGNDSTRKQGFDDSFLCATGLTDSQPEYFASWAGVKSIKPKTADEHIDDRITDEAIAWIKKNKEKPFFLNYWPLSVGAPFQAKPELVEKYKALVNPTDKQRSPTYAAMIEAMDTNIGKLLDALDQLEIADNTAIIFFSTNGGVISNNETSEHGAFTSNSPLRGGSSSVYEGGLAVPCIVSWPNITKANSRSDAVIQGADFYPTFVSLLNLKTKPDQIFDGVSIGPALVGRPLERKAVFTHFPHYPRLLGSDDSNALGPCTTLISGGWKLIRVYYEGDQGKHGYRLYNLSEDIAETYNLASQHPEKVAELDAMIQKCLEDTKAVMPEINPDYKP